MKTLTIITHLFLAATTLLLGTTVARAQGIEKGTEQKMLTPQLKAGDYVWEPEVSPQGPVIIIVSLPEQLLYVYRNGVRIGRSTVSSGKDGHKTPTGVFTILSKAVEHRSSKYHEASMPYMERLTWGGVAIHAGNLPGYPESHGCIHVPMDFAKKLYEITGSGTTVVVTDAKAAPGTNPTTDPGLLLLAANQPPGGGGGGGSTPAAAPSASPASSPSAAPSSDPNLSPAANGFTWRPETAPSGPVSILFSSADRQVHVLRNGVEIGRASVGGPDAGRSYGSHVYAALATTNPDGSRQWNALGSGDGSPAPNLQELRSRLQIPPEFLSQVRTVVTPGTTLVVTDQPVNVTTQSGTAFSVLNTDANTNADAAQPSPPPSAGS